MRTTAAFRLLGLVAGLAAWSGAAQADCTSPAGVAGRMIYASNIGTMVFCNGTNWVSMAGWDGSSGGASSLAGLSDVNTSGAATGSILAYDGANWVVSSTDVSIPDWYSLTNIPIQVQAVSDSGSMTMASVSASTLNGHYISGTQGYFGNTSVGSLLANGIVTASFYEGDGSRLTNLNASSISGLATDRITSGTLSMIANSPTSYISLSTAGTTWGYFHSASSYLPQLVSGRVSSTNVSATVVNMALGEIINVTGPGGNFIASGTTSISASHVGTLKFATNDNQRMVIDANGNVGIGTTTPAYNLDVKAGSGLDSVAQIQGDGHVSRLVIRNTGTSGRIWSLSAYKNTLTPNGGLAVADETVAAVRLAIDNAGNVGIGTDNPTYRLDVNGGNPNVTTLRTDGGIDTNGIRGRAGMGGAQSNYYNIQWSGSSAYLWIDTTNVGAIQISSDRRLKKNIESLDRKEGLAAISQLRPVSFNWRDPSETTDVQYGFIAQEVREVLPNVVHNTGMKSSMTPDGTLRVDYNALWAPTIKSIQELKAANDNLRAIVREQGNQIDELKALVKASAKP